MYYLKVQSRHMAKKIEKSAKKKFREKVGKGVAHIQSTFNNTIVTITNLKEMF